MEIEWKVSGGSIILTRERHLSHAKRVSRTVSSEQEVDCTMKRTRETTCTLSNRVPFENYASVYTSNVNSNKEVELIVLSAAICTKPARQNRNSANVLSVE